MKTFKAFLEEEVNLSANVEGGRIDIEDSAVRDQVNGYLDGVTAGSFVTPYIALERVSKVLANYHIHLPRRSFLQGDSGVAVFPINQFGTKIGMTNDGEVVTKHPSSFHVYFEYQMNDHGKYDIFAEIVDKDELVDLLGDVEQELDEAVLAGPETGPRKKPGADSQSEPALGTMPGCEDDRTAETKRIIRMTIKKLQESEQKQINEIGDTAKGKRAINDVAHRADDQITNQAMKSRPNKKKLNKALRAASLAINTDERRGGKVLNSYIKSRYGLDEDEQLNELDVETLESYIKGRSKENKDLGTKVTTGSMTSDLTKKRKNTNYIMLARKKIMNRKVKVPASNRFEQSKGSR